MIQRYYSKVNFQRLKEHTAANGPILITGHTGFKGSWLGFVLDYLEIEWVGYSFNEPSNWIHNKSNSEIKNQHIADINDLNTLKKIVYETQISTLVHLAAKPLVQESYHSPHDTFMTNIIGTSNVIQACLESENCSVLGIVTTDKVYKNQNSGIPFRESDQLWGNEPYSSSKVGAEIISEAWHKIAQSNHKDVSFRLLRSGNVIGGGDYANNRIIPDLARALMNDTECKIRNPKHTRPWLHVLEPLVGYLLAIQDSIGNKDIEAYNFGPSERSLSVEEICSIFNDSVNGKLNFSIDTENRAYESSFLELDSTKSLKNLNWKPKYSQKKAVEITANWWLDYQRMNLSVSELINRDIHNYFREPNDLISI